MQQTVTNNPLKYLIVLFVSAIMLVFTSCQKDSDISNPPPAGASKIKEYKNGDEFVLFTYNGDGTIKKATVKSELNTAGEVVDFNVSYDAQKKITEVNTSVGEKIVPEYENCRMIRASYFAGPLRTAYTNYWYEAGNLKRATIYMNMGTDFEPSLEFIFTYDANGNLTESVLMMANGVPGHLVRAGHVKYEFDTKTNPLYEHRDFLALLWQGVSRNNITKEEHFDATQVLEDVYSYVYTYKANGLPESAVVTIGLPGQTPTTSALNFLYQ
ncbi:MAG: hypothetical protein JNN00_15270 [Chitinophagaceae bacterium]|nr:hypothetical protein [Chitinophagaceae bacterium]